MSNKTDTKLTFAAIQAMPRGERYTLFKDNVVKPFGAITKAKDAATEKMHMAFKVTASLKRDYAAMLHGKEIAPDMTEAKFFAQYCGGDVPARVKQLATFFNAVVLTGAKPLIPEAFVDAASVNTLERFRPGLEDIAIHATWPVTNAYWGTSVRPDRICLTRSSWEMKI